MMKTKFTMQYSLWLVCLALLFGQVGCRSDETQADPQPSSGRTDGEKLLVASTYFPGTREINYNPDKTPKRFIMGVDTIEVKYAPDMVTYEVKRKGKDGKRVYKLENGVVKSSTGYTINEDGSESEGYTLMYFYEKGKLVKESGSMNGKVFGYAAYFYDKTYENVISMESFRENDVLEFRQTYEYSDVLAKSDQFNELGPRMENVLFPRKSKYLMKKLINEDFINKVKSADTFAYELDSEGYVLSGKLIDGEGNELYKWTNTWQ